MKKKVLFISYGGGHVNMLLPVYAELKKNKNLDLIFLGCTTAQIKLKKNKIEHFDYRSLLKLYSETEQLQIQSMGKKLVDKNAHFLPQEESIAYLGINYFELENSLGVDEAKRVYQDKGRQAFLPVETFRRLLRFKNISLVITTNAPRSEKAVVLAAKEEGIKSAIIYDFYSLEANEDRFKKNGFGNLVCLPSKEIKQLLINQGRNEEDLVVTGNPAFDSLQSLPAKKIESLKESLNLTDKPIILWAKGYNELVNDFEEKFEKLILDRFSEKFHFIFRAHPNDPKFHDEDLKVNQKEYCCNGMALSDVLNMSDIVLTILSTVGWEGKHLGKTIYQINFESIYESFISFEDFGLGKTVTSIEQLSSYLKSGLKLNTEKSELKKSTPLIVKEIERRFL